jgi:hypothetical protein
MALRPEVSLPVGLATAAVVWVVYDHALPSIADARVGGHDDPHLWSTEKSASLISIAVVGGISLIAKDPTVFIIGGAMTIALSWWHRHANMVDPATGKLNLGNAAGAVRTPDMYGQG